MTEIFIAAIVWLAVAALCLVAARWGRGDAAFSSRSRQYLAHVEDSWRDATRTKCACNDCVAFRREMGWQ
jgi:hypothetical protein